MSVTQTDITYPSSIDPALTTLKALIAYPTGASNLAICVVMHGWTQTVADLTDSDMIARFAEGSYYMLASVTGSFDVGEDIAGSLGGAAVCNVASADQLVPRAVTTPFQVGEVVTGDDSGATATIASIATNSLFCIYPELRGRNGSDGTPDGGGREVQDIIDAIDYVLANYASETDASQIHIVGYSGGGGNVQSATARYPDRFNGAVTFFGMCDYGYTPDRGWWYTNSSYRTTIEERLGGPPSLVNLAYQARASILARRNYSGGHLYIYHDYDDGAVSVINAERIISALDALEYAYSANLTDHLSAVRWLHESPQAGNSVILAERDFLPVFTAKSHDAWTVPASGTLIACGWLDSSRFNLWLDDGLANYAEITYNTSTRTFTVRSAQTVDVVLSLKNQTPSASVTITLNGEEYTETANGSGVATYSATVAPVASAVAEYVNLRRQVGLPSSIWTSIA